MRDQLMFDLDAAPVFIALTAFAVGLHVVRQSRQTRKMKPNDDEPTGNSNAGKGAI